MKSLDMHKIEKEGKLQNLVTNKRVAKKDNLKCKFASWCKFCIEPKYDIWVNNWGLSVLELSSTKFTSEIVPQNQESTTLQNFFYENCVE